MTLSNDFKKFISVIIGGAYLVVFFWLFIFISDLLVGINVSNNFLSNNQLFFVQLIGCWIAALLLILIMPKKYRDLGYKLLLAAVILLTISGSLPYGEIWHADQNLSYNLQWSIYSIASLLAQLSITLLALSVLERWFISTLKKPILTNKKLLVPVAVIAVISLLITFGFSFVGLPREWVI
ncbi:MAG: hypothetical protein Q7K65_02355 [Candidatus Buchananbacteria bacterium]|nr:hypothetical protein [Candidatus Buchananbacteria bacterium]